MSDLLINDEFDLINKDMLIDSDLDYVDTKEHDIIHLFNNDQDDSTESVDSSMNEDFPLLDTVLSKADILTQHSFHPSAFHVLPIQQLTIQQQQPKKRARLSNEEKRQNRLLRNRAAAKVCRQKKKQKIQDMEERIAKLTEENQSLLELKRKLLLIDVMRIQQQQMQEIPPHHQAPSQTDT